MQRVHRPVGGHGPPGGDQRLPRHLAAEHPLDPLVGRPAAEDVHLDLLQVKQVEQLVKRVAHARAPEPCSTARKRERCRDDSAPGVLAGAHESARWARARVTAT